MGRRRPTSYRVKTTWKGMQEIARLLIADDDPAKILVGDAQLCRSSALYRTKTTGRYTAHLVWRDGHSTTTVTIKDIEVTP